jgi:hypothetical protein
VLLLHQGELGAAYVELEAYMSTSHFKHEEDAFDKVRVWGRLTLHAGQESCVTTQL